MADVRALLRQQREARRVEHPHAAYSDAGKLLCTLCREPVRTEAQWESHIMSSSHQQRLAAFTAEKDGPALADGGASGEASSDDDGTVASTGTAKRKLEDAAEDSTDVNMEDDLEEARRKRSKPAAAGLEESLHRRTASGNIVPNLVRRKSVTPSQGIEIQIPSRPTTPARHRERSSSSSQPPALASGQPTALPSRQASNLSTPLADSRSGSTPAAPQNPPPDASHATTQPKQDQATVDEAEWAAFEADMASSAAPYSEDATISRPAMTADESLAAQEAAAAATTTTDAEGNRKSKADVDIEAEREEATRALEQEFDEMQALEARVQRLKQKRDALLKQRTESASLTANPGPIKADSAPGVDKENVENAIDEEEDEEDDDDEEDDWDGFRFKAGAR